MSPIIFTTQQSLILASASPRRQQLLQELGIEFSTVSADIDETPIFGESPTDFARRMAQDKAKKVAATNSASLIIGADTVVALQDGIILGKPENPDAAVSMLQQLNNKTHIVMTGLCLCHLDTGYEKTIVEKTEVTFLNNSLELIRAYVKTEEPLDKAGSYGIQGLGTILIKSIKGSCTNVIGLPVSQLTTLLLAKNVIEPVL